MKGIILAAGRGSRMGDMTDQRPKCLIELNEKSLLDHQISAFKEAGINNIAIVTGYKREKLMSYGLKEFYNSRWQKTNMVSSLLCGSEWLQDSPFIVSYSDIFYSSSAIKLLKQSNYDLTITYDPNWLSLWEKRFLNPLDDAETFKLSSDCTTVTEIGNKANSINEIQGQYMGLIRFSARGWSHVMDIVNNISIDRLEKMFMTELLQQIISINQFSIYGLKYSDVWGEVDSQKDLKVLRELINNQN